MVLPGLTGSDGSTLALRSILAALGHRPVAWGLGYNLGPTPAVIEGVDALVRRLYAEDGRPVQLVGWSLGGVLARQVAARRPEMVRRVVTLGSPYRGATGGSRRGSSRGSRRLPVPATSVYSPSDGIVPPRLCTEPESALAENVGLPGSHNGLGHNPLAVYVVADRLALPPGVLPRFRPPAWLPFFDHGPQARRGRPVRTR